MQELLNPAMSILTTKNCTLQLIYYTLSINGKKLYTQIVLVLNLKVVKTVNYYLYEWMEEILSMELESDGI